MRIICHLYSLTFFFVAVTKMEDIEGVNEIIKVVEKLEDLEQLAIIRTQNQYLDEISSLTGMCIKFIFIYRKA